MITELVCVLKLQHGRSSVPQVRRRAKQDALSANTDSTSTSSVGRATLLHSEQLYGKITFVSYQFRETAGRDASSLRTTLQVCLRMWRPISLCEEGQRPARGLTV